MLVICGGGMRRRGVFQASELEGFAGRLSAADAAAVVFGAGDGIRTRDTLLGRQALYH